MPRAAPFLGVLIALASAIDAQAQSIPADLLARLGQRPGVPQLVEADGRLSFTVQVPIHEQLSLSGAVRVAPGLWSVRLLPSQLAAVSATHPQVRLDWFPPLRLHMDVAAPRSGAPSYRSATGLDGGGVVVGVVDTGVDIAHPDLRNDDGTTRVAWLLDLSRKPTGKHKAIADSFGCSDSATGGCAVYDAADLDEALSHDGPETPRDVIGHGTHVASLAAGNGRGSREQRVTGMAPGATLIVVRVTRGNGEHVSDADVLLAARFIYERAEAMGMPAVVNLSLGSDFGPHDGSTALEQGLASYVGPYQRGRALVVAAGNSGSLYEVDGQRLGIHTEARVAKGMTVRVPTRTLTSSSKGVTGALYIWLGWQPGDDIAVGLEGPGGTTWIAPIGAGDSAGATAPGGEGQIEAAVINSVVGSGSPLSGPGAAVYVGGSWQSDDEIAVLLEGSGTAELWVQGTGGAAPSSGSAGQMFLRGLKHGTVNVPATHPAILAVGATLNRTNWIPSSGRLLELQRFGPQEPPIGDSSAFFSGAGPTARGVPKPEISAPGAFVVGAMSRDAAPDINPYSMFATGAGMCPGESPDCYVIDEHHGVASGTSMASPVVAGAVALLLARDPGLSQPELVALLQAGARWPQGQVAYDFQLGPGALDVEGARQAYEILGRPILREPDPTRSWVVMASPYARPDPDWPVWGTVELRGADGLIADGFDAQQLTLEAARAVIVQPLLRVAPGLYTFAVAGPSGSGGQTMRVDVKHAGRVLGSTQWLPIGVDAFVAEEGVTARGGCATGRGGGWAGASMLMALIGVAGLRRRRALR